MTNPHGKRRGTRYLFSKKFRKHGITPLSKYLTCYKRGELVDIKGDGAIQKGMPYKYYHGRTGRVYNVTKHALGVIVTKKHRGRIMPKKINVRVEHVKKSFCQKEFIERVKRNEAIKMRSKEEGTRLPMPKRQPVQPRKGHLVRTKGNEPQWLEPLPYSLFI